jgi:hypothetical protein
LPYAGGGGGHVTPLEIRAPGLAGVQWGPRGVD